MTETTDTAVTPFSSLMPITKRPENVFVFGEGSWLIDSEGRRFLDFIQGWAVNCLGHSPEPLIRAITEQVGELINCSPAFYNAPMIRLADALTGVSGMDEVFFANSGAEANEGAIKLARKWGSLHRDGAYKIVTMDHGFHGRTLATMSASGKKAWETLFEPKVPGFTKVPLGDTDAVSSAVDDETVAVMLEPTQGEAGVFPAGDEYLRQLRALADDRGILLILDEVQTGMGRTGKLFAFEYAGISPDILTLGKGMGGGVPVAALLAKREVSCFEPGDQGGTFNGNPLMMAAGLAVFDELTKPGFLDNVVAIGAMLSDGLEAISEKHGFKGVRGRGLLLALDLGAPVAPAIVEAAMAQGLLINSPRPDSLRFMPALNVTAEEVNHALHILDSVLDEA